MAAKTYLLQPTKKSANTQMFFWAGIKKERHKRPQMEIKPRLLWSSQVRYSESVSRETRSECGYSVLGTLAQIQKLGQTKSGSDRQREVLQLSTNPNNLQE
jgi:hypothetical protein